MSFKEHSPLLVGQEALEWDISSVTNLQSILVPDIWDFSSVTNLQSLDVPDVSGWDVSSTFMSKNKNKTAFKDGIA